MIRQAAILRAAVRILALALCAGSTTLGWGRVREPNSSYAERRAKLRAQVDGPVALFGYTGREIAEPVVVFNQEQNFYYLTGHNEPGAALLLVPDAPNGRSLPGPREILLLPPHDPIVERWEGPRLGPTDPGVEEKTGFEAVEPFASLRGELDRLAKVFPNFYTLLPGVADKGYPHARIWLEWLKGVLPQTNFRDVARTIAGMRQVKSASELALLDRAIELSIDAHLEAMRMMRAGLYEYQVAARMEYVHKYGGCESEAYEPVVGAGFNSTVLHYSALSAQIQDGDVVVLDVGGQYGGYAADVTRTLPANGKFTPRQREIYEIVLGAQNAVFAALKPGMTLGHSGSNSLFRIAYDYLNSHGRDKQGRSLGRYFISDLGHHMGLLVQDVGDRYRLLEPGMVITIEPGIYIPEESLGVRIEDDVLITETGYNLLTARLPRTVEEIEKLMAEPRAKP